MSLKKKLSSVLVYSATISHIKQRGGNFFNSIKKILIINILIERFRQITMYNRNMMSHF